MKELTGKKSEKFCSTTRDVVLHLLPCMRLPSQLYTNMQNDM